LYFSNKTVGATVLGGLWTLERGRLTKQTCAAQECMPNSSIAHKHTSQRSYGQTGKASDPDQEYIFFIASDPDQEYVYFMSDPDQEYIYFVK